MKIVKLIKQLELLSDSCESNYALEVNGYTQGVSDAIDLVKRLNIPIVSLFCETCQDKGQYYAGTLIGYVNCPDCNE